MKVKKTQTETYVITDLEDLDAVTVYVTNFKLGQGKITIECFGQSWSCYWGAMGERCLQQFFLSASNAYIADKLVEKTQQTDFDEVNKIAHERGFYDICVTSDTEIAMIQDRMTKCFGDDWYMDLPQCNTSEYNYVCRILDVVKAAFNQDSYGKDGE